ncbi:MAG: helix-turn-helix domain-containing protein [Clostridia bacterium]|nr:helix-turn-helix domain-containing protein [Clostridia bacterium]
MTFGEKFKNLRIGNGFTQEELAEKLSVKKEKISRWEKDEEIPSLNNLRLIEKTFGVTLDELVSDENNEGNESDEEEKPNTPLPPLSKKMKILVFVLALIALTVYTLSRIYNTIWLSALNILCLVSFLIFILRLRIHERLSDKEIRQRLRNQWELSRAVAIIAIIAVITTLISIFLH